MEDVELAALGKCLDAVAPLNAGGVERVARYLLDRVGVRLGRTPHGRKPSGRRAAKHRLVIRGHDGANSGGAVPLDIPALINRFKASAKYGELEQAALTQVDWVRRVLIALALGQAVQAEGSGMTSGEIAVFYKQLGAKADQPTISRTLSGRAKRFVLADTLRTKGAILRYRLSPQGVQAVAEMDLDVL